MSSLPHRLLRALLMLLLGATMASAAPATGGPDKDPKLADLLAEARRLIDGKMPEAAMEKCDRVIAAFKAHYQGSTQAVFCARTPVESLVYLMRAAVNKTQTNSTVVLSYVWSDAYFMKAFAAQDLSRVAEAKTNLLAALGLSPDNSQYHAELGVVYQLEKDWPKATAEFEAAEKNSELSPDETKASDLARARRGVAYVLVELGKLDEAEAKYKQCLATDPKDSVAKQELKYVRDLRAKQKK